MNTPKPDSLEKFVERHRADFDTHEPRPDLWAALEQQLAGPVAAPAAPVMRLADAASAPVAPAAVAGAAVAPERANWLQRYGVAAALALLVVAAGASEAWKSKFGGPEPVAAARNEATSTAAELDAALYQSTMPVAIAAADRSTGADSQLVRAVRGMEAYYTSQLARRQSELHAMTGPGMANMAADWQRELVSLDSSYRKLKVELLHHPQPDAVLTAMNRNLQIRLDILDQQLQVGTPTEENGSNAYVLADSRNSSNK